MSKFMENKKSSKSQGGFALSWATNSDLVVSNKTNTAIVCGQDYILNSPYMRRLCNEFYGVFLKHRNIECRLHQSSPSNGGQSIGSDELQRLSFHYQTIIRSVINEISNSNDSDFDNVPKLKSMLIIWSLVDALLLRSAEILPIADLCEWSISNFGSSIETGQMDIYKKIYRSLCQANVEQCIEFLKTIPNNQADQLLICLIKLLQNMPPIEDSEKPDWYKWQMTVKKLLNDNYFLGRSELEKICKILSGDLKTINFIQKEEKIPWYECLAGKVLFTNKFCRVYELIESQDILPGNNCSENELDEILIAVLELDMIKVLKLGSSFFPNWIFVAHLSDLLYAAGCAEINMEDHSVNLREHLILEYANSLMTHQSLWQLAVEYFLHCPNSGKPMLKLYIERMGAYSVKENCNLFTNDHKILKLLEICRRCDFTDSAKSIAKACCIGSLKSRDFNKALMWCMQAEDPQLSTFVAEQFLTLTIGQNSSEPMDVTACLHFLQSGLKSSILLSNPSLLFLSKYNEFLKIKFTDGYTKQAANFLSQLISCKISPRKFWPVLLEEMLLLLQSLHQQDCGISLDEVYNLMSVVENVQREVDIVKNVKVYTHEKLPEDSLRRLLSDTRLLLNRQLQMALVF